MTVLDFRRQGSTRFIAQLKQDLLEILITEHGASAAGARQGPGPTVTVTVPVMPLALSVAVSV
jgi:hypothetical protein